MKVKMWLNFTNGTAGESIIWKAGRAWKCFMIARKGHQLSRTMTKKVVIAFEEK